MGWELAPPSWEAVATLITGIAAVAAAVYVGRRQTEIADRQVEIQSKLVKIEALKIRAQLYEERRAVEGVAIDWMISTLMAGHPPRRAARLAKDEVVLESEIKLAQNFREAVIKSAHLFGPNVVQMMKELRDAGRTIEKNDQAIDRKHDRAERKGEEADTEAEVTARDQAFEVIQTWFEKSPALFAPALSLSEID